MPRVPPTRPFNLFSHAKRRRWSISPLRAPSPTSFAFDFLICSSGKQASRRIALSRTPATARLEIPRVKRSPVSHRARHTHTHTHTQLSVSSSDSFNLFFKALCFMHRASLYPSICTSSFVSSRGNIPQRGWVVGWVDLGGKVSQRNRTKEQRTVRAIAERLHERSCTEWLDVGRSA